MILRSRTGLTITRSNSIITTRLTRTRTVRMVFALKENIRATRLIRRNKFTKAQLARGNGRLTLMSFRTCTFRNISNFVARGGITTRIIRLGRRLLIPIIV